MTKLAPDSMIDASLDFVAGGDFLCVCSTQPTNYTEANATYMLAKTGLVAGDFTKADDTSGRKITIGAKSGISITNSGSAQHIAIIKSGDSTLRYVTTCTTQALVAGGTVDVPAWKINIEDPA